VKRANVKTRTVDKQGRITLPKAWRDRYLKGRKVIVRSEGDIVEIRLFNNMDLAKHFDTVAVDLKADLSDWSKVKKELLSSRAL
jgi:bifunctional DNA-binding transcriptional regulator/antitoxin component of YhaV-PrlF toxin-antitoxin module